MNLRDILNLKSELGSVSTLLERVKTDSDFRDSLEKFYFAICGKRINKGCSNCWHDAYLEILHYSKENSMEKKQFQLRAGAIIVDKKTGVIYNQHNITDEFALEYIKVHPDSKVLFSVLPDDLDVLLVTTEKPPKKK